MTAQFQLPTAWSADPGSIVIDDNPKFKAVFTLRNLSLDSMIAILARIIQG